MKHKCPMTQFDDSERVCAETDSNMNFVKQGLQRIFLHYESPKHYQVKIQM